MCLVDAADKTSGVYMRTHLYTLHLIVFCFEVEKFVSVGIKIVGKYAINCAKYSLFMTLQPFYKCGAGFQEEDALCKLPIGPMEGCFLVFRA